jgi:hypothetical protein
VVVGLYVRWGQPDEICLLVALEEDGGVWIDPDELEAEGDEAPAVAPPDFWCELPGAA